MIVEDERVARNALTTLLTSYGYPAVSFETAEELLNAVEKGTEPQVILADVDLPGMSGLEMIDALEERYPGMHAVVITAVDGEEIRSFLEKHGCDYLRKPLNLANLLSLLQETPHN
jgi:two-component system nitrogen regulation response regulator GlnG